MDYQMFRAHASWPNPPSRPRKLPPGGRAPGPEPGPSLGHEALAMSHELRILDELIDHVLLIHKIGSDGVHHHNMGVRMYRSRNPIDICIGS